ncbi:MAG: hypothetical protein KF729_22925 [Sandaracinaceae bacterium]|nr:hypothetical protein [Sandaracinaceae bacterium]
MPAARALFAVKLVHTLVWAVMAGAILALPLCVLFEADRAALAIILLIAAETAVLLVNGWRCPLTRVAERYTDERAPNFDIFLPRWLAEHNKAVFGSLFVLGLGLYALRAAGLLAR